MKIYTKTGDLGETGLFGGSRVPKNHVRIEACGTVDEANALIGEAITHIHHGIIIRKELENIQGKLFDIGAVVATPEATVVHVSEDDVQTLEASIDHMTTSLPELRAFILPGGSKASAVLHVARSVIRRAERRVVTVGQHQYVPPIIVQYLNRLSDYLFTLARYMNYNDGQKETHWHQKR